MKRNTSGLGEKGEPRGECMRYGRKRMDLIMAAAFAGLGIGAHYLRPDGDGGGGGGSDAAAKKKAEEEAAAKKKADEEAAAAKNKKLELTQEELEQRIAEALDRERKKDEAARKKAEDKKKAEEEAAARKKAEEAGDVKKLYETEQAARSKAEQEASRLKTDLARERTAGKLRDYLAEKHADYLGVAKYMLPLIAVDTDADDAEVEKRVKAAAEQYVKDNPRKAVAGAPGSAIRNKLPGQKKTDDEGQGDRRQDQPTGSDYIRRVAF